ncbi:MAG: DUF4153 domain-containing protein, partial [Saprospiraceae bacterium]
MQIPSPGFLISAFFAVCRRFPGTMLCAILGTFSCIYLINEGGGSWEDQDLYIRIWITCQLGLPFLTSVLVFSESKNWDEKKGWLLQILGIGALVGCWFWLNPKAEHFEERILPQYMALILVAHLAVAVAPFLNARPVREFWEYNRQLFANLIVGAAFTLILFVGLSLAILAVDNLFDTHIPDRIYPNLFSLLAGIFNTAYFLFHFPQKHQIDSSITENIAVKGTYGWVFRNLCKYILIPIVILYFVILYAYGAKIGLEWSLPKGWVSSLVVGFSVAGIFSYLLNFYLPEEDKSLIVTGFKRWFWWVLLPLTGLLFIAIGKRISDYGVTEERFLVAQLGIWLALSCLYFLFSKNDNIKFIPISLGLFALAWAFGPLSAFSVSERSQKRILIEILERNGRLENGKFKPGNSPLTGPEQDQASSIIYYLQNRNELSAMLPVPIDSTLLQPYSLLQWLKIDDTSVKNTRTLSISPSNESEPLDVSGYDLAYNVNLTYTINEDERADPGNFFGLSQDNKMLEWRQNKAGKTNLVEMFSL